MPRSICILCAIPFSLENYSDIIRWSLDLPWQRPDFPNGFHGIADSVLMRTSKDPDYKIDWSKIEGCRRTDTTDLVRKTRKRRRC